MPAGLEIIFFALEQFCPWVQNFRSKFGPTRSRKCIYYDNGPKVEGANVLKPVANCTFVTANFEPWMPVGMFVIRGRFYKSCLFKPFLQEP